MKKRSERKKLCIRICLTVIAVVTALIFIMPIVLTISNSFMSAADHLQLWFYFPENGYRGQAVHLSDGKPQIYTGYGDFLTVCDRVI